MKEERKIYEEMQELINERKSLKRQERNETDQDKEYELSCKERDLARLIKEQQARLNIIEMLKED